MTTMITPLIEPIKVIANILQNELDIKDGNIMLGFEKWNIPSTPGLYVSLIYIGGQAIGNNNYFDSADNTEHQEVSMHHVIQIDALSFDSSARARKEEIFQALRSLYAQQQAEKNIMQIARIPSNFIDVSNVEATKMLNRFTTTISVTALHTKVKAADYYNTFKPVEVHDNE